MDGTFKKARVVYAPPGMGLTSVGIGIEVAYEDVIRENIGELTEMVKAEGRNPGEKRIMVSL